MLKRLSISNFAIIDFIEVSFDSGLTSITGETGAGKSIILGALSLVLGKRADLNFLKDISKKCIIEADFDISKYNLSDLFDINNLDYEKTTILRRELVPSGKSRAFINDTPVNLDELNNFSSHLIDIHSQNETHSLFSNSFQFKFLDSLSNTLNESSSFRNLFFEYSSLTKLYNQLLKMNHQGANDLDYKKFLLTELESINLNPNAIFELENQVSELSNVDELKNKLSFCLDSINFGEYGILNRISDIINQIKSIENISNKFKDYSLRIESLFIELKDIANDFEDHLSNSIEFDPELLKLKNKELDRLNSILKKHNVSNIEDLILIKNDLSKAFFDSESLTNKIEDTHKLIEDKKNSLLKLSTTIHDKRSKSIPGIEKKLNSLLSRLGMKNTVFKIELLEADDFSEFGKEKIEFLFSSNSVVKYKQVKKIASGGELSRIMLSIKYLMSKFYSLPTIIFDEIDTGVSGLVANQIGVLMKEMSGSAQVLTITHIPQVAAKGNNHIKVYKKTTKLESKTMLKTLNKVEREEEIALMLSAKKMTKTAKLHAKELLD